MLRQCEARGLGDVKVGASVSCVSNHRRPGPSEPRVTYLDGCSRYDPECQNEDISSSSRIYRAGSLPAAGVATLHNPRELLSLFISRGCSKHQYFSWDSDLVCVCSYV